jgi:hypothetical protein
LRRLRDGLRRLGGGAGGGALPLAVRQLSGGRQ